jgi:hypothetical protein
MKESYIINNDLDLKVTFPKEVYSYREAIKQCPEDFRLPYISELYKIFNDCILIRNFQKGEWLHYWSANIEGDLVMQLSRAFDKNTTLMSESNPINDLDERGRVIYVKKMERRI